MIDDKIIELKELQIDNLLEYKGEIVKVTMLSRDIDDEYEDQICFVKYGTSTNETGGWNRSLVNDLKRIPLTPVLLYSAGFSTPHGYDVSTIVSKDGIMIDYHLGKFRLRENNRITIDYLHQLQNLYYALTGEELIITL